MLRTKNSQKFNEENFMKKSILATAIAASMVVSTAANADVIDLDWNGIFTMGNPTGNGVVGNPGPDESDAFGTGTFVSGTMSFDTATGLGSATMVPFTFSGSTASLTPGLTTMTAIGDGMGGPGTLVLAAMDFNWGPNTNIPVYVVGDAAGFFGASGPGPGTALSAGDVVTGVGALSTTTGSMGAYGAYANPALSGPLPFAMTSFDVQQTATTYLDSPTNSVVDVLGGVLIGGPCHPSGAPLGCALTDDGISGVSMATPPFAGHHANFDITTMTITGVTSAVPVPAAVWLFGSGLLGLVGVARRRKA